MTRAMGATDVAPDTQIQRLKLDCFPTSTAAKRYAWRALASLKPTAALSMHGRVALRRRKAPR